MTINAVIFLYVGIGLLLGITYVGLHAMKWLPAALGGLRREDPIPIGLIAGIIWPYLLGVAVTAIICSPIYGVFWLIRRGFQSLRSRLDRPVPGGTEGEAK